MEILDNLIMGFGVAVTLQNLAYCFIGVLVGTLIGVLPGIGPLGTIAMLRIPRIAMEVPVGYGTGERVLFRGAGVIEGTALPGTAGNVAIAAHRDSFFRGLKDVEVGDLIEIETLDRTETYRVSTLTVVEPSDVSVLAETSEHSLTLVTCYPFNAIRAGGPLRYIVTAQPIVASKLAFAN